MRIEEAFTALKFGKPIRRLAWDKYRLLRFSEMWMGFSGQDIECINASCLITGADLLADDWIVGRFNPVTGDALWGDKE
jgi:hypothetical protein